MTDGKTRGQVWRWVRRILLGIVAVAVILVLAKGIRLATLDWRTGRAATEAFEESRESGRETMAELSTLVERDLEVPVTYSADGYTCSVVGSDQGWFTVNYYQTCSWTRVDYVQVDDAQLERLVEELGGVTTRDEACPRLYPPFEDGDDERFRYVPVYAHPAGASGWNCELPGLQDTVSERPGSETESVVLEAVDPALLDPDQNWISVSKREQFFRKDLGCGFGIIFCTQPMGEPAMPEVPEVPAEQG